MVYSQTTARQWRILRDPLTKESEARNAMVALIGEIDPRELRNLMKVIREKHPNLLGELMQFPAFARKSGKK